ncbi:helix-turn-helix transcriptional regulator [Sporolactobacillus sp. CPB3-1]|uniref:Helix-turn-helix transcriptional regulator n=1 Tax=Sporolactobacillus mangiferae TaxID=2940498 RepID=A0ABT0M682_9BACL|nr:helix-turn-helix transcriptional regulator [Sporolactobacillus mangiferae]MCL1630363.1 helix-turn-helix transcriptional regulator [Sporolactobacillus mangiferae]
MSERKRHQELGDFLRTRRERLTPEKAGLTTDATTRRTPGLRREEVAALSGVSLAWYTYLEQGRPINVSAQVLESLARTLQLDEEERHYLYRMAGHAVPSQTFINTDELQPVPEAVQLILGEIRHYPAYVVDSRLTVVAWNVLAERIFGPFENSDVLDRNLVWRMFTREDYRHLFTHWEYTAKSLLAQFRSFYGKYTNDPWLNALAEKLTNVSDEFKTWWSEHDVDETPDGNKEINHPELGTLQLNYTGLMLAEKQNMVLTVFTPRQGTDTENKMNKMV